MAHERSTARTLFNRQHQLQVLEGGVDAAVAGHGHLYLLSGVPGVGKTSLLEHVAVLAQQRGALVLWSRAVEHDLIRPFSSWTTIVSQLLAHPVAVTVEHSVRTRASLILSSQPRANIDKDEEPTTAALIDAIVALLHGGARKFPLVLLLDDLQTASLPSLRALELVARSLGDSAMLVVGAYRKAGAAAGHLTTRLADLARHGTAIPVRELDVVGTRALAASLMEREPSLPLVAQLHEATGGNPFFLEQLVRRLVADDEGGDEAHLDGGAIPVPEPVRDLVHAWFATLAPGTGIVLETAAVIGRQFDVDLAALACGMELHKTVALVVAAESDGLLQTVSDGVFRFRHGMTRATLHADIPPERRRALHDAVGAALEARHAGDLDAVLGDLAEHFVAGDVAANPARALRYVRRAGERALALHAYKQAVSYFEQALTLLDAQPGDGARVELQLLLAGAALRAGDYERARQAAHVAAADARALRSGALLAQAALLVPRADTPRADTSRLTLLEEAGMGLGSQHATLKARVDAHLAHELALSGERQRGDVLSRSAVALARATDDVPTLAVALAGRCKVLSVPSHDEERLALSAELLDRAQQIDDPELVLDAYVTRISDGLALADNPDHDIRAAHRLSEEIGQPYYRWQSQLWRSMRATLVGDYDTGKRLAADAYAIGNQVRPRSARIALTVQTIIRLWQQGEAARLLSLVEGFAAEYGHDYPACAAARIWALANAGRQGDAVRGLAALAADGFHIATSESRALVVALLAEACAVLRHATHAASLYERLQPCANRIVVLGPAVECLGPADRYLGLLATLRKEWQVAETHFAASLEISRRLTAPPFVARTLHSHAAMLCTRGRREDYARAQPMLDEALAGAERFGMTKLVQDVRDTQTRLAAGTGVPMQTDRPSLTREAESWTFAYRGTVCSIRASVGVFYLAALLEQPHLGMSAEQLLETSDEGSRTAERDDDGPPPPERPRRSPAAERARVRVTRALRDVIDRVCLADARLGRHFSDSIRTGKICSYAPADQTIWKIVRN